MNSNLPLNAVRSFVVAAKSLSFTQAAEILCVTPGAVSRLVKKLEQYLDAKLFLRTQQGLELTDTGQKFLDEIVIPLSTIQNAAEKMRCRNTPDQIRVICHPTFAARWLLPRWSDFYEKHPNIKVQITTTLKEVDLQREPDYDIAIQLEKKEKPLITEEGSVRSTHFLDVDITPVCSPKLTAGIDLQDEVVAAEFLKNAILIHAAPLPSEWKNWMNVYVEDAHSSKIKRDYEEVDCDCGPEFQTLDLSIKAAIEGVGVAIVFSSFVTEELRTDRLTAPFKHIRRSKRSFHIQNRPHNTHNPAIKLYRDWLLSMADGNP